ncbi:unnamed protein product [Prunus brigantina]
MGFRNWKKKDKIRQHIGGVGSVHNQSRQYCLDLMNQKQHIQTVLIKQSNQARIDYRICLTASLDCVRFLLKQGLPFRGRDESDTSNNKGNYVELLQFLADHDEKVKAVVLENAPRNLKLIAPTIQKDLVNVCATKTIKKIIKDMDSAFFSLLVDESHDISVKEQMAVLFRYVDKKGDVIERFVGIQFVTLVAMAKGNADVATFFTSCNSLVDIVGVSCRQRDMLRDQLQKDITVALENDNLPTG